MANTTPNKDEKDKIRQGRPRTGRMPYKQIQVSVPVYQLLIQEKKKRKWDEMMLQMLYTMKNKTNTD